MEFALPKSLQASTDIAIHKVISWSLFIFGLVLIPLLGLKSLLLVPLALIYTAIFILPITTSIFFFFVYLMFDGAIKILSNYHPLIHVAQDIFLLSLVFRVISDSENSLRNWLNTPYLLLFITFSISILVQFLNPFGLGLLPSIAGAKVYLSGIILFFLIYHHIQIRKVDQFLLGIITLGVIECSIALVEYFYFPEKIFELHPKYKMIAADKFIGVLYRPFGTTYAPGAPSLWVFLCAPFAFHGLTHFKKLRYKAICLLHFALAIPTLLICQTRSAMVLTALTLMLAILAPVKSLFNKLIFITLACSILLLFIFPNLLSDSILSAQNLMPIEAEKIENINKRALTLTNTDTFQKSRGGALNKSLELAGKMPLGIGLSRVGAASAVWKNIIMGDKNFGTEWSFADNVYRAIFTELGVFGLLAWLLLMFSLVFTLMIRSYKSSLKRRRSLIWICACIPVAVLIGGFGSEGVLYMPVGGFLWASLAIGLRESDYV